MEPFFYGEALRAWFDSVVAWLFSEVFTPASVVYAAMQIPAVVGAGFGAWWVHDFVFPLLTERINQATASDTTKEIARTAASLLFPGLWVLGLWVSGAVAVHFAWPHDLIRVAVNLLVAWIIIRFLSSLVRDSLWARVITVVAYSIAVLNILHVLAPTLALLDSLALSVGSLRVSVLTVFKGMILLGVLLWAAMFVSGVMERRVRSLPSLTPSVQVLIGKLLKATLITLAVLVSLTSIGIDFTALAVFSGALGVGIGFGLQKIISNLLSGIMLLMDKSIKPGDIIQIGGTYGWVASLGARYVAVETRDGIEFLIPNEEVITRQVINWSHRNDLARIKVPVRIAYSSDVRKALELMTEACEKPKRVLRHPAPKALLLGFGDSSMDLELRFWIRDAHNGIRNISSDVMLEIWDLFRRHDIMIPIPRREIHVHNAPYTTASPPSSPSEFPGAPPPGVTGSGRSPGT